MCVIFRCLLDYQQSQKIKHKKCLSRKGIKKKGVPTINTLYYYYYCYCYYYYYITIIAATTTTITTVIIIRI